MALHTLSDLLPAETSSPDGTRALGARLGEAFEDGDVIGLYGDLGAGKTELVRGVCTARGVSPDAVRSPTFTILHTYEAPTHRVHHFDAYRLRELEEMYDLGYEDFFFGDGISLVEWADRVETLLPEDALRIELLHAGGNRRKIRLRK